MKIFSCIYCFYFLIKKFFSTSSLFPPFPCVEILMIPQTVPSGTSFPLRPQPAPVGLPLQALGLGQEVRCLSVSSLGKYLLFLICLPVFKY